MIFESEFLIMTLLVFSGTAAIWWHAHGPSFSLADLTIIEPRAKSVMLKSARDTIHVPVLLPIAPQPASITTPQAASNPIQTRTGEIPLDTQTQLNRVSNILQSAIDLAAKAERLHNAAHEKLDSAHYAFQNLLDELSAVMPIATPSKAPNHDARQAQTFHAARPVYETALAA